MTFCKHNVIRNITKHSSYDRRTEKMFAQLGDKEQVDVMVDFYNYIYSIQQDEFKERVGLE